MSKSCVSKPGKRKSDTDTSEEHKVAEKRMDELNKYTVTNVNELHRQQTSMKKETREINQKLDEVLKILRSNQQPPVVIIPAPQPAAADLVPRHPPAAGSSN